MEDSSHEEPWRPPPEPEPPTEAGERGAGLLGAGPSGAGRRGEGHPSGSRSARSPKQARGVRTRRKILRAAIRCFEASGYDATTTAGIAGEASVGVGTVYSYFENKRDILLEIIRDATAPISETVIEHLDPTHWIGGDPRAATRLLIDLIFHTQDLTPGMRRVMWERYFKDPDVFAVCEAIWARTRDAIKVFLDEVERAGQLRAIDRESATHVIQNAVQWNATRAFADGHPARIDACAEATADMISRFVFRDPDGAVPALGPPKD